MYQKGWLMLISAVTQDAFATEATMSRKLNDNREGTDLQSHLTRPPPTPSPPLGRVVARHRHPSACAQHHLNNKRKSPRSPNAGPSQSSPLALDGKPFQS
ncbi:hypothetical protein SCUP515_02585 [Seiridium cupressi]